MVNQYYPNKHQRDEDLKRMKAKGYTVYKIEPRKVGKGKSSKLEHGLGYTK